MAKKWWLRRDEEPSRAFNPRAPKDVSFSIPSLPRAVVSDFLRSSEARIVSHFLPLLSIIALVAVSILRTLIGELRPNTAEILLSALTLFLPLVRHYSVFFLRLSLPRGAIPLLKPSTFICALPLTRLRLHTTIFVLYRSGNSLKFHAIGR